MEFSTLKDLIAGYDKFMLMFHMRKRRQQKGCMKCVVRVKNDFADIKDNSWDLDINNFGYADIKLNILLEYNEFRIVGELQMLLSFMIKAKKMGHSIYSFCRKKDYFEKIGNIINSYKSNFNDKEMFLRMKKIIFSHNMQQLSLFFQTMNIKEINFLLRNKDEVSSLFKQSQWQRGLKLFELVIKRHDR